MSAKPNTTTRSPKRSGSWSRTVSRRRVNSKQHTGTSDPASATSGPSSITRALLHRALLHLAQTAHHLTDAEQATTHAILTEYQALCHA